MDVHDVWGIGTHGPFKMAAFLGEPVPHAMARPIGALMDHQIWAG
jgi:hypothetical protein